MKWLFIVAELLIPVVGSVSIVVHGGLTHMEVAMFTAVMCLVGGFMAGSIWQMERR